MDKHFLPDTIEEAAKILDECVPNWYNRIDTDILHMASTGLCIIGQLSPGDTWIIEKLFKTPTYRDGGYWWGMDKPFGFTKGFNWEADPLRLQWIELINQRRGE